MKASQESLFVVSLVDRIEKTLPGGFALRLTGPVRVSWSPGENPGGPGVTCMLEPLSASRWEVGGRASAPPHRTTRPLVSLPSRGKQAELVCLPASNVRSV